MAKKRRPKHRATSNQQVTNEIRTRILHADLEEQRLLRAEKEIIPEVSSNELYLPSNQLYLPGNM